MSEENKVKFGLKNVHVAKLTFREDGTPEFRVPKHIPGSISLSLDPEGSSTKVYADDSVYYQSSTNNGYTGELENLNIPEFFLIEHLGFEETDGMISEIAGKDGEPFAMLFEFNGDKHKTRHILYHCTASRIPISAKTEEGEKSMNNDKLSITAIPLEFGNKKYVKTYVTPEKNKARYDAWYLTAPTFPTEDSLNNDLEG